MKVFYKENGLLQKYGLDKFNFEHLLDSAMDLKLDLRKKFLISKALSYIDIEKKETSLNISSSDVEASIKLEELKHSVITSHIHALFEVKDLFSKLKSSTSAKDIAVYSNNIRRISLLQKSIYSQYNYIIREHPDAKNKEEVAYKLANGVNKH
ncbi:hypothetical protein PIROE2DRAFT_15860 [Piromyces sp. E2]|nr:hypothetical protein PIROE2DRAFT_15860 [Piromyces sp. E2]|eukprot:OUM58780.1 hypothetical protein PIROE2DRAFT_15860 [Piromyces sp. E2]